MGTYMVEITQVHSGNPDVLCTKTLFHNMVSLNKILLEVYIIKLIVCNYLQ